MPVVKRIKNYIAKRKEIKSDRANAIKRGKEGLPQEHAQKVFDAVAKRRMRMGEPKTLHETIVFEQQLNALQVRMSAKLALDKMGIVNTKTDSGKRRRILSLLEQRIKREKAISDFIPETNTKAKFNKALSKRRKQDVMYQEINTSLGKELGGIIALSKFERYTNKHFNEVNYKIGTASVEWRKKHNR